jgi:hypothetical protein
MTDSRASVTRRNLVYPAYEYVYVSELELATGILIESANMHFFGKI